MNYTLQILSVISGVIPALAALFNYKQIDVVLKVFVLYLLISFCFDIGFWLAQQNGTRNDMPGVHAYIAVSLALFTGIYYLLFIKIALKKAIIALSAITSGLIIYDAFKIWVFPSISNTALSIFLIICSLIYFYQLLSRQEFIYIEKQGLFWINAGVLFYSAVNIFFFMIIGQLPKAMQSNVFMIHSSTNIIANILFTIGLLCQPQKTT
ncbi:hypothetical protein PQ469_26940 [Mucilaginibacter sp. KACC 22773]|uniref:hypothetical protein n=1 Tax=Mucilaginibacter sp. KACC 22773 TaxID=3025671 RepID=UPI002366F052|nr:hypothetical protein [Mucilaginibacter sp. KACC 22773]WDF77527.1 hypothetical protein PQ469_26940 [Mucilaginibacter sp. KACC 22773]